MSVTPTEIHFVYMLSLCKYSIALKRVVFFVYRKKFRQLNDIWGIKTTPKISQISQGMTMKFLPDVGIYKEAQNQKNVLT